MGIRLLSRVKSYLSGGKRSVVLDSDTSSDLRAAILKQIDEGWFYSYGFGYDKGEYEMNMDYDKDMYNESRDQFYNFCITFTKWNDDHYFEMDDDNKEYRNKNVEAGYQCWFSAYGFGYDKGVEHMYMHLKHGIAIE